MNWGLRITFLYVGFVVMILALVGLTMRQKVDLVSKDYYEQELRYQDKIDKINRTRELAEQLTWGVKSDAITLLFPSTLVDKHISGTIFFFNPSDASKDKNVVIQINSKGEQTIPTEILHKGHYKMQINWASGKEEFYNEGVIQIH
jgi:hypothetical protein